MLGEILRQRGYDAIHVLDAGRAGKSDAEQLAYAVSRQRAILTHNVRHFRLLNQKYHEEGTLRNPAFSSGAVKRFAAQIASVFRASHRRLRKKQRSLVGGLVPEQSASPRR